MAPPSASKVTQLLLAWSAGDKSALEKLIPLVHKELHRLAKTYLSRERPGHALQTTALVNEAYMRLVDVKGVSVQNRAQFFGLSAQIMRNILVDFARSRPRLAGKREAQHVSLDEALTISSERSPDLVALDESLNALAEIDPRQSRVVELRFFGGLTIEETAEALGISPNTVMRDWQVARAWLYHDISGGRKDEPRQDEP
ncbi:MAG: sigma-70 family RNA polymerase sigma factor [Blastocatellia bacterium]